VANHYSARFDVHQGSCSGVLCARIMAHHQRDTAPLQARASAAQRQRSALHRGAAAQHRATAPPATGTPAAACRLAPSRAVQSTA